MTTRLFNTVSELKAEHDERFVRLAYCTILFDEPSQETLDNYCQNGSNSEELLVELSNKRRFKFKKKQIFFNLSTSKHWRNHPVGIVRVERELANYLKKKTSGAVQFVFFDLSSNCFKTLDSLQVNEILEDSWCNPQFQPSFNDINNTSVTAVFNESDTLISVGLDWDLSPMHEITEVLHATGCKGIFACYDIVPILFPEFCVRENFDQLFKRHFVDMAHIAHKIFAISENTKNDLIGFLKYARTETELPSIEVVSLACLSKPTQLPALKNEKNIDRLRHIRAMGEYVIYVSSFEARKNHRLLLNIWRDLYSERGDKCPQLVIVGMSGWGVNDLIDKMQRMSAYIAGKIIWLQDVDDGFLLHLYEHCSFSVFPSLYEGWGLAATEAMSFGRICVVANNSSLTEATQNLMPSYHPLDYLGWKHEIEKLLDNATYKTELEKIIQLNYQQRSWQQFSEEFCEKLLTEEVL